VCWRLSTNGLPALPPARHRLRQRLGVHPRARGRWCARHDIHFTRRRPYKKDDHAHLERKNWTHVGQPLAWDRYDTPQAVEALNDLYRNELRLWMNLF
jgi:hypothetical protein